MSILPEAALRNISYIAYVVTDANSSSVRTGYSATGTRSSSHADRVTAKTVQIVDTVTDGIRGGIGILADIAIGTSFDELAGGLRCSQTSENRNKTREIAGMHCARI